MLNPFLISKLQKCKTGEEVDAVFTSKKITDYAKRIEYIRKAMGNPILFFDTKSYSDYITARSMFITDSARILMK